MKEKGATRVFVLINSDAKHQSHLDKNPNDDIEGQLFSMKSIEIVSTSALLTLGRVGGGSPARVRVLLHAWSTPHTTGDICVNINSFVAILK